MKSKSSLLLALSLVAVACGSEGSTAATENPLGVLVECDEVIEEIVGYFPINGNDAVVRHKVAHVPVEDPLSVTLTRCGDYYSDNEGPVEPQGSWFGTDCYVSGGRLERGVTFTPDFNVYVECEEEQVQWDGSIQRQGAERVYLRVNPKRMGSLGENPLGVPVECDDVLLEEPGDSENPTVRRSVAYVPVADPTSVTITRCGEYYTFDGETRLAPRTNCVVDGEVEFTADSHVVVDCGDETTYPVGTNFNGGQGGVELHGYEQIYVRIDPRDVARTTENPLGVPVECDDVFEWETGTDTYYHAQNRWDGAYVPFVDPLSVTVTRCGKYEVDRQGVSTQSDNCVVSKGGGFTSDFELYFYCEAAVTQFGATRTTGYKRIYYRVD